MNTRRAIKDAIIDRLSALPFLVEKGVKILNIPFAVLEEQAEPTLLVYCSSETTGAVRQLNLRELELVVEVLAFAGLSEKDMDASDLLDDITYAIEQALCEQGTFSSMVSNIALQNTQLSVVQQDQHIKYTARMQYRAQYYRTFDGM